MPAGPIGTHSCESFSPRPNGKCLRSPEGLDGCGDSLAAGCQLFPISLGAPRHKLYSMV